MPSKPLVGVVLVLSASCVISFLGVGAMPGIIQWLLWNLTRRYFCTISLSGIAIPETLELSPLLVGYSQLC
jgi:hypothetical protein